MSLRDLLTQKEPLGPIDQSDISDESDAAALIELVPPFLHSLERRASIVLGRKGSGKSSVLSGYKSYKSFAERASKRSVGSLPNGDYVVPIVTWDHFHDMVRSVARQRALDLEELGDPELVSPERVAEYWFEAVWDEVIKWFYGHFVEMDTEEEFFEPIRQYFEAEPLGLDTKSDAEAFETLFERAKGTISYHLSNLNRKCYVLFDSMEKYPVRNQLFYLVAEGFLRSISKFNAANPNVDIIFCFPEELEAEFRSSNYLKDFKGAYRLRWKPIDLLRAVAHRYRLFLKEHDPEFYLEFASGLDLSTRDGVQTFFRKVLPPDLENKLGQKEDPLAYIVRHTHLVPRHILLMMNKIIIDSHEETGGYRRLLRDSIVKGIRETEELICDQMLSPYKVLYPLLLENLPRVIADVGPIATYQEINKVLGRLKGLTEVEPHQMWNILYEIGMLGRMEERSEDGTDASSRYRYARFHFVEGGQIGAATDALYCFHPTFSRYYGLIRRGEHKVAIVYPSGVEEFARQ